MLKKIFLLVSLIIFFFLLSFPFSSSVQTKMLLKECLYSFGDSNFNSWNPVTQTGVFMKSTNIRPVFGNNANFSYTNLQGISKNYYNNFVYTTRNSSIPMLNVKPNQDNNIYANCSFITSDYQVTVNYFLISRGFHAKVGCMLTSDFNLTQGITINKTHISGDISSITDGFGYSPEFNSPYSIWYTASLYPENSEVYAVTGNLVDQGTFDFAPNSNFNIYSKYSIGNTSSCIYSTHGMVLGNNEIYILYTDDMPVNFFYINSTVRGQEELQKRITPLIFAYNYSSATVPANLFNLNKSYEMNKYKLFSPGDILNATVRIDNPFNFKMENITISTFPCSYPTTGMGTGSSELFSKCDYSLSLNQINLSINASSSKSFSTLSKISEDIKSINPWGIVLSLYKDNQLIRTQWGWLSDFGNNNFSYLGIGDLDPRIKFNSSGAYFVVNSTLIPRNADIPSELYNLSAWVYNSAGARVYSKNIILDQPIFMKYPMDYHFSINDSEFVYYQVSIPINSSIFSSSNSYSFRLLTVLNKNYKTLPAGTIIADTNTRAKFKPGEIVQSAGSFDIYFNSRNDTSEIKLYNPSFYPIISTLNLTSLSDNKNLTFCYDSGSGYICGLNDAISFNLGSAGSSTSSKTLSIMIKANYTSWPLVTKSESLIINVRTNDVDMNPTSLTLPIIVHNTTLNGTDCSEGCIEENLHDYYSEVPEGCLINTVSIGDCNTPGTTEIMLNVSWTNILNSDPNYCPASSLQVVPCDVANLGFFDLNNLIITLLIISTIYVILIIRKKY